MTDFCEAFGQVLALPRQRGRAPYRALKRHFDLDDDVREDLKEEILSGQRLAAEEDGCVLVWTGGPSIPPRSISSPSSSREEPQVDLQARGPPTNRSADPQGRTLPADGAVL